MLLKSFQKSIKKLVTIVLIEIKNKIIYSKLMKNSKINKKIKKYSNNK